MTKIGWAISKNYLPYETYQRGYRIVIKWFAKY